MEPFPDHLLADQRNDPEDRILQHERISLAFLVALQHLTPVQRAILLLREVLEWHAVEVAEWLNLSVPAVNSALQRARRALRDRYEEDSAPLAGSRPHGQDLLERYMALWERADVPGLAALLREDAWFTMPPVPTWFQGREPSPRCSRSGYSLPEGNRACSRRAPMGARLSGFTSRRSGQRSISS